MFSGRSVSATWSPAGEIVQPLGRRKPRRSRAGVLRFVRPGDLVIVGVAGHEGKAIEDRHRGREESEASQHSDVSLGASHATRSGFHAETQSRTQRGAEKKRQRGSFPGKRPAVRKSPGPLLLIFSAPSAIPSASLREMDCFQYESELTISPPVPAGEAAVHGRADAGLDEQDQAVGHEEIETGGVGPVEVVGVEEEVVRVSAAGVGAGEGLDGGRLEARALAWRAGGDPAGPAVDRARPRGRVLDRPALADQDRLARSRR